MADGDFTGDVECAWIMAQLETLCGGRAWEVAVPDEVDIERVTDGGVKPYIIGSFASPTMSRVGRNIASPETGQPHILTFTVKVIGSSVDDVKRVLTDAKVLLTGKRPADNSGVIQLRGGFSYPSSDTGATPGRIQKAFFGRVYINL